MQAHVYEGYFHNGQFYVSGRPVHIPGRRRAVLTIFGEEDHEESPLRPSAWLDEFRQLVDNSAGGKLRTGDFPRMSFGRESIIFENEE